MNWELVRDWLQTAAALVFLPVTLFVAIRWLLITKIWPATFFGIREGKARKELFHNPPQIEIKIPVRLHCRVQPGVDSLCVRAFGRDWVPEAYFLGRYAEGYSFDMPKGKTPLFELRIGISGIPQSAYDQWSGGEVEIVMEHGYRKGTRAIRQVAHVVLVSQ